MTLVDINDPMTTTQPPNAQAKKDLPPSMIERMTLILDAFDGRAARLTLEEIVCRTQLPRSTVHRILDQIAQALYQLGTAADVGRRGCGRGGQPHLCFLVAVLARRISNQSIKRHARDGRVSAGGWIAGQASQDIATTVDFAIQQFQIRMGIAL